MAQLTPVDDDPFATPSATAQPKLTPVDDDPFAAPAPPKTRAEIYKDKYGGDFKQDMNRSILQGLTTYSDELLAGLKTGLDVVTGNTQGHSLSDIYNTRVERERAGLRNLKRASPNSDTKAKLSGMALSLAGPGLVYKGLTNLGVKTYPALAVTGASAGMHYGSGSADVAPDASLGEAALERVGAGLVPAAVGAVAAPAVGALGEKVLGPLINYGVTFKNWMVNPENAAYKMMLDLIGPENLDKLSSQIATAASRDREDVAVRTLKTLGEEMSKSGGDVAKAKAATVTRVAEEFGVQPSTVARNMSDLQGRHKDSGLFFAEYPAVAGANEKTRLLKGKASPEVIGRIEDTPVQNVFDDLANSGGTQSVSMTKNALMERAKQAGPKMIGHLQQMAPDGKSIDDVASMIADLEKKAGAEYGKVYASDSTLVDNAVLHKGIQDAVDKALDRWASRGGEQKAAIEAAVKEFYIKDPISGQQIIMPSLQMAQDMRGALRGIITRNAQAGNNHIVQALQPFYNDVSDAMRKASPQWGVANDKYAEKFFSEKATELGDAFSTKAGPRYREQLAEFKKLDPDMQAIIQVHYLQKLQDQLENAVVTHDISKFYNNIHTQKAIRDLFGEKAAREWARVVRDAIVQTTSKNMLGNSKTASRLARQEAGGSDEEIVAAAENMAGGHLREWIMKKMKNVLHERKNRELAKIATTPMKNTAEVAKHLQRMREVPETLRRFEERPALLRDRSAKGATLVTTRSATENQRLKGGIGPRYDENGKPRAHGGRVEEAPMKKATFGSSPRGYDQGGVVSLGDEPPEERGFLERLFKPVSDDFYGEEEPALERLKTMGAGAIDGATFGMATPDWAKERIANDKYGDAMVASSLATIPASAAVLKGANAAARGLSTARPTVKAVTATGVGLGTLGASASAANEGADTSQLKGYYEERAALEQQRQQAIARREANRPKGRPRPNVDVNYFAADQEAAALAARIQALDSTIADEKRRASPEYALDMEEKKRQQEENAKREELDKGFNERHPYLATGVAMAGIPLAAVGARYGLNKIASKGDDLVKAVDEARKLGDIGELRSAMARLEAWNKPSRIYPKQAAAISIPALAPVESRLLGDQIDKYSLPETSKAQQRASQKLSNPEYYLKEALPAVVAGGFGAGMGAKFAKSAPRSDAEALSKLYGSKKDSMLSPRRPQTVQELKTNLGDELEATADVQATRGMLDRRNQTAGQLQDGNSEALDRLSAPKADLGVPPQAPPAAASAPATALPEPATLGTAPTALKPLPATKGQATQAPTSPTSPPELPAAARMAPESAPPIPSNPAKPKYKTVDGVKYVMTDWGWRATPTGRWGSVKKPAQSQRPAPRSTPPGSAAAPQEPRTPAQPARSSTKKADKISEAPPPKKAPADLDQRVANAASRYEVRAMLDQGNVGQAAQIISRSIKADVADIERALRKLVD